MKNTFNSLKKYIFENSVKEYNKETVNGLFRSILEPVIANQKFESCILFRLLDLEGKESLLKRLSFTGAELFSFSDKVVPNLIKDNIWGKTEFLIVLGQRYSAAFLWDYETGSRIDYSNICLFYNSKIITDIVKIILDNSSICFKDRIQRYTPDRRENLILNSSIMNIVNLLNDKSEEVLYKIAESKNAINSDDVVKSADIVAQKAKFIAHEIKNNLSIVNLYAKITEKRLEKYTFDDETRTSIDNAINNINTASNSISSLINDLRCLSSPYITVFNLKDFILNTIKLCEEKIKSAGMSVEFGELANIDISSDKTKLQCALTNVIFNAVEAGKEGGVIHIETKNSLEKVCINIYNNGDIIPAELHSKIFEPDFTTKEKGNGLGLAICKKQLEVLGGDIELIHSTETETLFRISVMIKTNQQV